MKKIIAIILNAILLIAIFFNNSSAQAKPNISVKNTNCSSVSDMQLTLVADVIFDTIDDIVPKSFNLKLKTLRADAHILLKKLSVNQALIATPLEKFAPPSSKAPIRRYSNDPIVLHLVDQLQKIREHKFGGMLPASQLTVGQLTASIFLYAYTIIGVPLAAISGGVPPLFTLLTVPLVNINITAGMAISGLFSAAPSIFGGLVDSISNNLSKSCQSSKIINTNKSEKIIQRYSAAPRLIQEISNSIKIADGICSPISNVTLRKVFDRTVLFLGQRKNKLLKIRANKIQGELDQIWVWSNHVPVNPEDFDSRSTTIYEISKFLPFTKGFPGLLAGNFLSKTKISKNNRSVIKKIKLLDLTVNEGITTVQYAYAFAVYLLTTLPNAVISFVPGLNVVPGISTVFSLTNSLFEALNTYGIEVYRRVLRSVCLVLNSKPQV